MSDTFQAAIDEMAALREAREQELASQKRCAVCQAVCDPVITINLGDMAPIYYCLGCSQYGEALMQLLFRLVKSSAEVRQEVLKYELDANTSTG